jgi:hypothetical protein
LGSGFFQCRDFGRQCIVYLYIFELVSIDIKKLDCDSFGGLDVSTRWWIYICICICILTVAVALVFPIRRHHESSGMQCNCPISGLEDVEGVHRRQKIFAAYLTDVAVCKRDIVMRTTIPAQ